MIINVGVPSRWPSRWRKSSSLRSEENISSNPSYGRRKRRRISSSSSSNSSSSSSSSYHHSLTFVARSRNLLAVMGAKRADRGIISSALPLAFMALIMVMMMMMMRRRRTRERRREKDESKG